MEYKSITKETLKLKSLSFEEQDDYQQICCPSCDESVTSDNININDKIAKCDQCHVAFPFQIESTSKHEESLMKQDVNRPEGIDIYHFKDQMDITIEQNALYFLLDYLGIMIFGLFFVLTTMIYFVKGDIPFIVPLIFTFLTMLSSIRPLARDKHKINLTIDNQYLYLNNRPKYLSKDKHFDISDIKQVYVKSDGVSFSVMLVTNGLNGEKHIKLLSLYGRKSKAKFIEQEVERHLNIKDYKVPEESTPPVVMT